MQSSRTISFTLIVWGAILFLFAILGGSLGFLGADTPVWMAGIGTGMMAVGIVTAALTGNLR